MTPILALLFAVVGGVAVGNLYWAQPLLTEISKALQIPAGFAGTLVTVTQMGYALGVFLIVPLGDTINRRRLIPLIMFCSAVALSASALAPNFPALLTALAALGLTTVAGQLLTPFAGDLAKPEERGRIVGTIVSGMLSGILLSRTVSGFIADVAGWRSVYAVAAVITVILGLLLARHLPQDKPRAAVPYPQLLLSVVHVVQRHRRVQITLVIGATAFSVFSMFWTAITFLLSSPPFSYSVTQIGLVGLVGLAGALAARRAGILHDRGWSVQALGSALLLALVSIALAATGAGSIIAILVTVLLLDVAIQAVNVLNQTRLLSIDPSARSRLNTAFVTSNFIGGAIGSALAGILWEAGGWTLTMTGAGILIIVSMGVWFFGRKTLSASSRP